MPTLLAPVAIQQFKDNNGGSLVGGQLYTYQAGTSIPAASYTDATGTSANTNPLILNSRGEAPLWLTPGQFYKIVLQDASGVLIWSADQVPGGFVDAALLPNTASSDKLRADLLAAGGAGMMGFSQSGVSAVTRTTQIKLRESVSVKDFGAVGDGVTNDRAAFLAAFVTLGTQGGTVRYYDKHLIDSSLTVPTNITLQGPYGLVGSPGNNTAANYGNMSAIILNSAASITLSSGAGHRGGLVYRKGLTFPVADSSAFAGTAFTAGGDDAFLIDSMVLGFNIAYYSSGVQRPRIYNTWLDNINGIQIKACFDIARVYENHAWPFATIVGNSVGVAYQRTGTAFLFSDGGDWNKCSNNFSYGYSRGTQIINCNSMTVLNCSHDNTTTNTGSIGIEVLGTSTETRILGCQVAAHFTGIHIGTNAGTTTYIEGSQTWTNQVRGLLVDGGHVVVNGGGHRGTPEGITVNNSVSIVFIDNVTFDNATIPVNSSVASITVHVGNNNSYLNLAAGVARMANSQMQSVASAGIMSIKAEDIVLTVTGTTSIGTILSGSSGRTLTLLFNSSISVLHSFGANGIRLSGGATYIANVGGTLTLLHNGQQWFETGRST